MKERFKVLPETKWTAKSPWKIETTPLIVLIISLCTMGIGDGLLLLSNLGSSPWTVFAQGFAIQGNFSVGWASLIISAVIMLLWVPLKLKAGIGTILNMFLIALLLGVTTEFISPPETLLSKFIYAILGIIIFSISTVFYLTSHQGAGPRDGLMVGICYYFNWKVGIVRTILEIAVCFVGWLLGGTVGIGTLLFAVGIGWIMQFTLNIIAKYSQKTK